MVASRCLLLFWQHTSQSQFIVSECKPLLRQTEICQSHSRTIYLSIAHIFSLPTWFNSLPQANPIVIRDASAALHYLLPKEFDWHIACVVGVLPLLPTAFRWTTLGAAPEQRGKPSVWFPHCIRRMSPICLRVSSRFLCSYVNEKTATDPYGWITS